MAFTGYRPQKMPFGFDEQDERCIDFKKRLRDTIESFIWQGYQHFISGGALGMDMYAAETVLELKKQYPEIMLEMVSPFDAQAAKWAPEYQQRHDVLFDNTLRSWLPCATPLYLERGIINRHSKCPLKT